MQKILVVDDERSMREFLKIMLEKEGYNVSLAENGLAALFLIENNIYDMIITDMKMPKKDGIEVLEKVKMYSPETVVIVITAFATDESRINAMKMGAYDYISKPFKVEEVKLIVNRALADKKRKEENLLLRKERDSKYGLEGIIGKSPQMEKIYDLVRQVSDTKINVMICGESGTGKELIARAIHRYSSRRDKPFVTINCSAIPESLMESELFGHKKGAFTGAVVNKQGLFKVADNGTIFLDEIGEISPHLQIKLLRVIQEKLFKPVGGIEDEKVDVRIIAATNRNLEEEVKLGNFREDLYYRLNVIQIKLPPLRERKSDIPLLAEHFLEKYKKEFGKDNIVKISSEAMKYLQNYDYPGNIRELENIIERSVALEKTNIILPETLPPHIFNNSSNIVRKSNNIISIKLTPEGIDLDKFLNDIERDILEQALILTKGVKKKAANLLNISFRSIRYRLDKHNLNYLGDNNDIEEEDKKQ